MTRALSTPPVISAGVLAGSPQPVLPAAQGLPLRPWEPADVPAFLSAYADDEIRRWHTRRPLTQAHVHQRHAELCRSRDRHLHRDDPLISRKIQACLLPALNMI